MYEPPYEPDGRVLGLVRKNLRDKCYGFIADENGQDYFFLTDSAVEGCPLGHTCLLSRGVEVSFLPKADKRRPGLYVAEEIQMLRPPVIPDTEESTIRTWHISHGWSNRDCGCSVFVSQAEVLSEMGGPLALGDRLRHRTILGPHTGKDSWMAVEIDVFIPDFPPEEQQGQ